MLAVSEDYISSITKQYRNRSYQWLNLKIYNNEAAGDVTVSGVTQAQFSDTSIITQEQNNMSGTYATLEPDRFLLDGSQLPVPYSGNYTPYGYISEELSDANGNWTTNPKLTLSFGGAYAFSGLTLYFDPSTGDYISELKITWYAGSDVVLTETVYPASATFVVDSKTQGITTIELECIKSSVPYRRARIQKVLLGLMQSFDSSRISSSSRTHEIDPLSRRLPTETFTITILDFEGEYNPDNPESYWEYVDALTEINVVDGYTLDDGGIEQLEPIHYILDGKPSKDGMYVTFTALRKLGTLTGMYRRGAFSGGVTLKQLAEDVLTDALGTPPEGEIWWVLDDILDGITTTAPLPVLSHRECLQLIAHAGMCALYTNASGQIVLQSGWAKGTVTPAKFNRYTQTSELSLSKVPPLYAVDTLLYQYSIDPEQKEIYKATFEVNGTYELWCDYQAATDITIDVDGATLDSSAIYAYNALCAITGQGTVTVTIYGRPVTINTTSSPYISSPLISGETDSNDNALVVEWAHKRSVEKYRVGYLELRNTYTGNYRGNPELEPLDITQIETEYVDGAFALILRTVLNFNGGLSGEMTVKRITNWTDDNYMPEIYAGQLLGVL